MSDVEAVDEHVHDSGCIGHVAPNVYDGVLAWQCSDGQMRNVWKEAADAAPGNTILQQRSRAAAMIMDAVARGEMDLSPFGSMGDFPGRVPAGGNEGVEDG